MDMISAKSLVDRMPLDTGALKKFAQEARRLLRDQVSAKLVRVLVENSAARREAPKAVRELETEIVRTSRDRIIERVAYTWFNRMTALRFMDANGYTAVRVVTPADGQTRPEVLSEAMAGVIGDEVSEAAAAQVRALLDNRTPSPDPQGEAYRLLLVATCNHWHAAMPFMFEKIADYTELLMPEDLLSQGSILAKLRAVMTDEACLEVEVIGWLYQFYISEKKDEVFAGLKKNVKISAENIPAATQLFTPHWIVRYLVENSLGRLWIVNRPDSRLKERMEYYIAPEEAETDFLRISSPEEITICDPACGSGHMLTYAFDLLHAMYEEEGYDASEIPGLILAKNLYGIEIDDRAGALAAFALTMKAAARRKRFLRRTAKDGVQPNVCVLENVSFKDDELADYVNEIGRDLFSMDLRETLGQFREAKNFGSLIVPKLKDVAELRRVIAEKQFDDNLLLRDVHERVQVVLRMADYLISRYHVVVANPPYMGGKGMNGALDSFAKEYYPDSKSDLFSMFIERSSALAKTHGLVGMITMQSWMFLSRHQKLRESVIENTPIRTMAHLGTGAFDSIGGEVVSTTAFVLEKEGSPSTFGDFIDLREGRSEALKSLELQKAARGQGTIRRASTETFEVIDGCPIAHWISPQFRSSFSELSAIKDVFKPAVGLNTGDNDRFLRQWYEVGNLDICFDANSIQDAATKSQKWFPYNKGGGHRKWYGNQTYILNWQSDGSEVKAFATERNKGKHWSRYIQNLDKMFLECVTWSDISTSSFAARYSPAGFLFDVKGSSGVPHDSSDLAPVLSLLCSKLMPEFMRCVNPTATFQVGDLARVPYARPKTFQNNSAVNLTVVQFARADWDAFETSWDFRTLPLLLPDHRAETLQNTYANLRTHWRDMTKEMQRLEEENNRIFIEAYGLQDELTPDVPPEEITLTCNPAYRYDGQKAEAELEALLLADTVRELVSYAVGCMFGRYSLDAPGLVLANRGEGPEDYRAKVPNPSFEPDTDNVIPVLDGDWFADDIAACFRRFLRVTFGEKHFQENLAFVEEALGKDIKKYFIREFFNDHVKRYKKRPIYWMFSSPKGTFNALIYMHRYRPDTVSVVLNDYLREFRSKLEAYRKAQEALSISADASPTQKTKALKAIEATAKQLDELDDWERDVLFPLATQKIEIDLDDGVKANYQKFGAALKPIKGLNDSDD